MRATAFLAAAATGLASAVMALDPIDATGNKFFNKNGTQFFMKGNNRRRHMQATLADDCQVSRTN